MKIYDIVNEEVHPKSIQGQKRSNILKRNDRLSNQAKSTPEKGSRAASGLAAAFQAQAKAAGFKIPKSLLAAVLMAFAPTKMGDGELQPDTIEKLINQFKNDGKLEKADFTEVSEDGRIVKGVNTTVDVGVNQTKIEAAKFGNTVTKDGVPPTLSKQVKGKSTNVLFNMGLAESLTLADSQDELAEALGELDPSTEIYVDMDGVLADFFGEWARLMGKEDWRDIKDVSPALAKIRATDDFWLKLPVLPQAKQLLALIKQVKGEYNICTSPLADDPNSEPHKRVWIEKNLGFFPPKNVYITHNKPQYATNKNGKPNILIDDYGVNIDKWEAAGGIGFKYKDHKFERTAKAIKQHMQEPATEAVAVEPHAKGYQKDKLTMPKNTLVIDTPGDLDWYKLGQDIANLDQADPHEYGQGDSDVVVTSASPEEMRKLMKQLDRLGLKYKTIGGTHDQPEIHGENFADGKKPGRKGLAKRSGVNTKASVSSLRKTAKSSSGEKQRMAHWLANMKAGKAKKK
jgi:5'(3')-deoxyribonucleotidase/tellurite resistance protein